MRLRGLADDLEAVLLVECPASLRLALLIFALLLAHLLGLVWAFGGAYEREMVRAEVVMEVSEIRNQQRHLWSAYEAIRERQDRKEAGIGR